MATQASSPQPPNHTNGSVPTSTEPSTTIWKPFDILTPRLPASKKFALVVLNQPLSLPSSVYSLLWSNAHTHIGADGGANRVYAINRKRNLSSSPSSNLISKSNSGTNSEPALRLDTVIGDLDSLEPDVRSYWESRGTKIIHERDQDSTDFTKAVDYIHKTGHINDTTNSDIVVLGGLGGRVDQGLSVLHHLYIFQSSPTYASGRMYLLSSEAITFVLQAGVHKILVKSNGSESSTNGGRTTNGNGTSGSKTEESRPLSLGTHIGIIPMREPAVITTFGLEWDVTEWETSFGGRMSTSNLVREEWVTVQTDKAVLFTIDLDFGDEVDDVHS